MTSDPRPRPRGQPCRLSRAGLAGLLVALLAACASDRPGAPREYLDERTAATITVSPRTAVFACDRTDLGIHARDYVTLTAVDVNTSGRHAGYVLGYAWSTLDKRGLDEGASSYELVAEDRVLRLTRMPMGFEPLGLARPPLPPPSRAAVALAAPVTRELLEHFLASADARVVRTRGDVVERFAPWPAARAR